MTNKTWREELHDSILAEVKNPNGWNFNVLEKRWVAFIEKTIQDELNRVRGVVGEE